MLRRVTLLLVLVIAAVLVGASGAGAAPASASAPSIAATAGPAPSTATATPGTLGPASLTLVHSTQINARLQELTFTTPALASPTHVRVLLPTGYDPSGATRYPVLYLLHGGGDSYLSWTQKGDAEQITAGYPMIVVMPDSGPNNGYVNWFNNGVFGPPEWETYHIDQLLPWIDEHYPTIGTRAGRAIAGLSMGGGGAMTYAARHPDLFVAAAAFSGAVDLNVPVVWPLTDLGGGHVFDGYGPRLTQEVRWRGHNGWDLAVNLRGLFLVLDTGNGLPGGPDGGLGDPIEAGVHLMNVNFHNKLTQLGIPHVWNDYGPGGHNWYYWERDLRQLLPKLTGVFAHPPAAPSTISYRTIDPSYAVWGWNVAIARPALEFSDLSDAGPGGFTLAGSGSARVTTPPSYAPGQVLTVDVADHTGAHHETVEADAVGRVHVQVTLGPGNPYQEYSPQARVWQIVRLLEALPNGEAGSAGAWPVYQAHVQISPA